jgi:hypothetical protein
LFLQKKTLAQKCTWNKQRRTMLTLPYSFGLSALEVLDKMLGNINAIKTADGNDLERHGSLQKQFWRKFFCKLSCDLYGCFVSLGIHTGSQSNAILIGSLTWIAR